MTSAYVASPVSASIRSLHRILPMFAHDSLCAVRVRQLVGAAVGLVHAADLVLPRRAVGRGAVVERAAAAGDVELRVDDVAPQALEHGRAARRRRSRRRGRRARRRGSWRARRGRRRPSARGPGRGPGCRRRPSKSSRTRTNASARRRYCSSPGRAVEVDDRHVVRRADGAAGELERLVRREVLEEAGGLARGVEQRRLPGHLGGGARRR